MKVASRAVGAVALAIAWHGAALASATTTPTVILPRTALTASDVAVVINDADPLSVAIGAYYHERRKIPAANVIHVRFDPTRTTLGAAEFATLRGQVVAATPRQVQAYALTWLRPYRVQCMSITTAFAAGFDPTFCSERCTSTRWSPYFNSNSRRPFDDFGLRPTMSIAAADFDRARELIDRGIASDGTGQGRAYLVSTTDVKRNVRAAGYSDAQLLANGFPVEIVNAPAVTGKRDIMFYFIGASEVTGLASNRFLPGAIADHLTSLGGDLTGGLQMSSLRWLEAGATGSFGTVTEPCNLPGKFPSPGLVMRRYLAGETLLEAYWKSVAMPGQGLFIGEPLANPFGGYSIVYDGRDLAITANGLPTGHYDITAADRVEGPYATIAANVAVTGRPARIRIRDAGTRYYQLVRK